MALRFKWFVSLCLALCPVWYACSEKPEPAPEPENPASQDGPLQIAFVTDTHYGRSAADNTGIGTIIDDINAQGPFDFVIVGGDLTHYGTDAQLQGVKALLDKLKWPYYVVPGNHDCRWSESGCTTFLNTFGAEQFDFEAGGYRFLGCSNGPEMRFSPGLVSRDYLDFLKRQQKGNPVIFISHYPLDSDMANWYEVRRELIRLDCRFAIAGHLHGNQNRDYDGLPGMVGRATIKNGGTIGYNIISLNKGRISVTVRNLSDDSNASNKTWINIDLESVKDALVYDSDGLPTDFSYAKYSINNVYPQVQVIWKKTEESNIGTSFATDGNTAWYATVSGKLSAISVSNGSTVWRRSFGCKIFSTPAVSSGILVFAGTDGVVYALDAATGASKWSYPTAGAIASSPTIYENTVYIGGRDGKFRAFNLNNGEVLWYTSGISGFCDAAPFVDKDQIIFGTWGGGLYCLERSTGKLQWRWTKSESMLTTPGACSPVKSGGRVFIVCPDRRTYCVDAKKGTLLFFVDAGRESMAMSADAGTIFVKSMFGKAVAFPAQIPLSEVNGTLPSDSPSADYAAPAAPMMEFNKAIWYVDSSIGYDTGSSALTACGNLVLIPTERGCIYALDSNTGSLRWIHKVGEGLVNRVCAWEADGHIHMLASSMDGKMELLDVVP